MSLSSLGKNSMISCIMPCLKHFLIELQGNSDKIYAKKLSSGKISAYEGKTLMNGEKRKR